MFAISVITCGTIGLCSLIIGRKGNVWRMYIQILTNTHNLNDGIYCSKYCNLIIYIMITNSSEIGETIENLSHGFLLAY